MFSEILKLICFKFYKHLRFKTLLKPDDFFKYCFNTVYNLNKSNVD